MTMFLIFVLWRLVDVAVSILSPFVIPYLGFFPYGGLLDQYHLPDFLSHLASFDGIHYTQIADSGYSQFEQALFPLYPILIKAVTFITHNRLVSGLLISNIAFFVGLIMFKKYLLLFRTQGGKSKDRRERKTLSLDFSVASLLRNDNITWVMVFLLLFPTSFFFGTVYTEGLFFLLFVASLYFLKKKNYWLAGLFAALSSATRLIGVFLIIPFLMSQLSRPKDDRPLVEKLKSFKTLILIFSPLIGFILYAIYLWKTVGDPFFFFNAQPSFGANRSTQFIFLPQVYFRYLKIFFTAQWNFQYFVSLVEFVVFTFVFVILILDLMKNFHVPRSLSEVGKLKIKNYDRVSLNLFSFANLLLPTLTGTFSSIPRYALFSISLFLFLGDNKNVLINYLIGTLFFILHIILLGFFIQGYFVG